MAPEKRVLLASLRERVRQIERGGCAHGVLPFGIEAIDRALPGGGLARGALHEILGAGGDEEDGALPAAFATFLLGRLAAAGGGVLWCLAAADLYGPGLAASGLDPWRLFLVEARRDDLVLWAMEEGLRTRGIAAVAGEVERLDLLGSRRLQLAAERSGIPVFVLRRWKSGDAAARWRDLPNVAATRWRIGTLPSRLPAGEPGIGRPYWRVELLRCRGGVPACWEVEVEDGAGLVSVAQRVADRPQATEDGSPLALRPTGS
jgi:protein ImuA